MLRRTPQRARARAFTAAAVRIDPTSESDARTTRRRPQDWQRRAWQNYDDVGEVRFAARYKSDGLAKLRLYAAIRQDPEQPPINVTDETSGVPDAEQRAAVAALDRLQGTEGSHAELLRSAALNIDIPGEGILVGAVLPHLDPNRETWRVYSIDEFITDPSKSGTKFALKPSPDAKPDEMMEVPADAFVLRIWRQHPRWSAWADSAMRAANETCEELALLTQMVWATATSRVGSGLLAIPTELDFGADDEVDEEEADALTTKLIEHMATAIREPGSASRTVPFILRGDGEWIDKIRQFEFGRDIDRLAIELREEARRRFATMIDMPPEVLTGRVDLNHWTSWQVKEEADREVLNLAELILPAITKGYLQPSLASMGVADPTEFFVWYDDSELTSHPNEAERYQEAYDRVEVSGEAYRRASGIPEEDAPDDAERQRIIETKRAIVGRSEQDIGNGIGANPETQPRGVPRTAPPGVEAAEPVAASAIEMRPVELPNIAELALAQPRPPRNVGRTLADLEQGLRARIQAAADAEMRKRLERIGNQLRNLARKDAQLRKVTEGVEAIEVAATLGRAVVESMADDNSTEVLLAGAFETLRHRYELWVANAQRQAAREVQRAGGRDPDERDERELERLDRTMTAHRLDGWKVLEASLIGLAAVAVFQPQPEAPPRGEFDPSLLVPAGAIRESLTAAGGGTRPGAEVGGAVLGEDLYDFATASGLELGDRIEWVHGGAERPFEPHLDLSGEQLSGWTDERLDASDEAWLGTDFFYPGDHDGCSCEAVPFYTQASEAVSTGARGEAAPQRSEE